MILIAPKQQVVDGSWRIGFGKTSIPELVEGKIHRKPTFPTVKKNMVS
jgi:hypothetical protein